MENQKNQLTEKLKLSEQQRFKLQQDSESRLRITVKHFESELEEKTLQYNNELKALQERSENELNQLRSLYETEKE